MPLSTNLLKFLVLCIVWGLTWIATKIGIGAAPPLLFAGTRFMAAGVLVSLWMWREVHLSDWERKDVIRLFAASLLIVTLTYGPLYWGMRYVKLRDGWGSGNVFDSDRAFGLRRRLGQERWSWVNAVAMALGVAGICLLFEPSIKATKPRCLVRCRLRGE